MRISDWSSDVCSSDLTQSGWRSALEASGGSNLSEGDDGPVERLAVSEFLAFDRTNSSSILSCLEKARQNARSVRTALTRECFETLNEAWLGTGASVRDARRGEQLGRGAWRERGCEDV